VKQVSDVAMERLLSHPWHGNLRELRNIINGAMILCHGETLEPRYFHPDFFTSPPSTLIPPQSILIPPPSLTLIPQSGSRAGEILEALEQNRWNVAKTARQLGLSRTYVYKKLKELDIKPPR
jgi:transcriptional regulator of acetoin/glycerol metabolism